MVEEASLLQSVFILPKTLDETAYHPQFITTISGKGYRFVTKVFVELRVR